MVNRGYGPIRGMGIAVPCFLGNSYHYSWEREGKQWRNISVGQMAGWLAAPQLGTPYFLIDPLKYLSTHVFRAPSFLPAKKWKQPKGPSTEECKEIRWSICTLQSHSATNKNEVLLRLDEPWKHRGNEGRKSQRPHLVWFCL